MQVMIRGLLCIGIVVCSVTAAARDICGSTVGRWGYGPSRAAAASEHLLFFGSGIYLQVAELGDGAQIEILAELELPDIILDIEVRDGIAHIAASSAGLLLVDVDDPVSPVLVGRTDTPGNALRVALEGDLALVADHRGGLRLVAVGDPRAPRELSSMVFARPVDEAVPVGEYAYVATGSRIEIIDISRPSDPVSVGSFQPNTIVNVITIHENLALIGTSYRGLQIFDATHPTDPVWLGEYDNVEDEYDAVVVHDDHAFLGLIGINVVDISDPTDPARTTYRPTGSPGNYVRGLAILGDLLLAANEGDGLLVFDTSSGEGLPEVASYDVPRKGNALAVSGSTVYLGSDLENGDGIRVFDTERPSEPILLGSTLVLDPANGFRDIAVADGLLYSVPTLTAIDVSDPAAPHPAAYLDDHASAIEFSTGHLFTTTITRFDPSSLRAYDLSDPLAPVLIGSVPVPGHSEDLALDGDLAFVVSGDEIDDPTGGLHIFDVGNPAEPALIGTFQTPTSASAIALEGTTAYIADYFVLRIVDISDPSRPFQVGEIRLEGDWPKAIDVAVSGGIALVADSGGDVTYRQYVHVIDVSNPAAPRHRSRLPIDTKDIEAAGGLFYVADRNGGFRIIDPNTPCRELFVQEILPPLVD